MRGSIILFLVVILVLLFRIAHSSVEEDCNDEPEDTGNDDYDNNEEEAQEEIEHAVKDFVGTNLFGDDGAIKKCFSSTDVALLMARKDFENLIPKDLPQCLLDNHLVEILFKYFYSANQVIVRMCNGNAKRIAQLAFNDALGGFLQHYLIPVAKYSFYAGILTLKIILNILQLYNQCKIFLNTNGNGWMVPISDFSEFELNIEPIRMPMEHDEKAIQSACDNFNLAEDEGCEDLIVSLPKLDSEEYGLLSNIWFPFKRKHTFNLRSDTSAFILLRYFVLVTRCHRYQNVSQDTFNHKLKEWYQENIELHLNDEILYPGLGAVLRVMETLRNRKKFAPAPQQKSEQGISITRSCSNSKVPTLGYVKLTNKVNRLSDPSKAKAVGSPLSAQSNIMEDFVQFDDSENPSVKARRKKYITIAVLVALFLFVFILAVAVITKYRNNKGIKGRKKKKDQKESDKESRLDSDESEKKEKKRKKKAETPEEKRNRKKIEKEMKKMEKEKKKHEKEDRKKHEKEEKKHEKEEKKHEKEEKKHEKEEKKHKKEEKKHHHHEKEHKTHEKEEKIHEKEETKHDKEKRKHEHEEQAAESHKDTPKTKKEPSSPKKKKSMRRGSSVDFSTPTGRRSLADDSPSPTRNLKEQERLGGGMESSTSSLSTPRSIKRTSPRSKGGLKLNIIDEKGKSKRFSLSKKNKPIFGLHATSPTTEKRSTLDSGGESQLHKDAITTSWETID